jgi:hypothetical protein
VWVPSHAEKIIKRLERDVFPWLGAPSRSSAPEPIPPVRADWRALEDSNL